jgi:phosphopantetheine adenylyltransferase
MLKTMKLVYNVNGYKVYQTNIAGYVCQVHKTRESGVQVQVPMGKTDNDKVMFDSLVYAHKSEYNGKTINEARTKVRKFIKNYKKNLIK